jgi:hypothetical protein
MRTDISTSASTSSVQESSSKARISPALLQRHRWLAATVAGLSALTLFLPTVSPAAQKPKPRVTAAKPVKTRPPAPPKSVPTTLVKAAQTPTTSSGNVEAPAPTTATIPVATAAPKPTSTGTPVTFKAEVWADNWFAMSVNGVQVGEDSVPITTEKSFNAETFTFTAAYPLTIAIEAKDFKQNDSGLEYIGKPNQQMGDGGLIAQITDMATGKVVAVTNASWQTLVIHRAPLNQSCVKDANPEKTCTFISVAAPSQWTTSAFDDTAWKPATIWQAADVGPKDGYNTITWNPAAKFVWGSDLFIDNTVLLRLKVHTTPI